MKYLYFISLITGVFAQITLPPFRQISHDIQSGPIEVINNNTINIRKFYFDGNAPNAHFWVGKGQPSTNGTLVPYSNYRDTLPLFSNANITLRLPNLTINDIDYLSVWCKDVEMSLGHVFTNERWISGRNRTGMILPKTIGPFRKTKNAVSSGNIILEDERTVVIPNFNYNGNDKAKFWFGTDSPSFNGKLGHTKEGGTILSSYVNKNVTVILPDNLTVSHFDYLAVWSSNNVSFGHVFFSDTPDDMEIYIGKQYEGFENRQYGLRTGPIILVNQNTLYITNFHYRGFRSEYFWAGSEKRPVEEGFLIRNQEEFEDHIEEDEGSSFYVTLPSHLPENEIKYFGIWDNKTKALVQKISFVEANNDVPAKITGDGRRIIRYPKCCPHEKLMHQDGCVATELILDNSIPVYYANSTHLNDEPMIPDRILFVPFLNNLTCDRYFLDPKQEEDKFLYLTSGTLLFPAVKAHYKQDDFCLDLIESDDVVFHAAFICYKNYDMAEGIRIAICIFVVLSAICLLFTTVCFFVVTDRDDMRGTSVAGFAGFMGIAFICLFFTQIGLQSETLCTVLGFIFQFFILSSLIWLDALCFEIYYNIKYHSDDSILKAYKKRIMWYCGCAILIPLTFVIISISFSIPVGLINVNLDKKCFLDASHKKWLLYSPILLTMVIAIGITVYSYQLYYRMNNQMAKTEGRERAFWRYIKNDLKTSKDAAFQPHQALMLSVFLVAFTSLCWIFEVITYALESAWEPLDMLHALQGVFTMIIVLTTGQVWKKFLNRTCCRPSGKGQATELEVTNRNGDPTSLDPSSPHTPLNYQSSV